MVSMTNMCVDYPGAQVVMCCCFALFFTMLGILHSRGLLSTVGSPWDFFYGNLNEFFVTVNHKQNNGSLLPLTNMYVLPTNEIMVKDGSK